MGEIGIGVIGGGYMGKAHSVAFAAVASVFDTALRPELISICASSPENAERYRKAYGLKRRLMIGGTWWPIPQLMLL